MKNLIPAAPNVTQVISLNNARAPISLEVDRKVEFRSFDPLSETFIPLSSKCLSENFTTLADGTMCFFANRKSREEREREREREREV